MPTDIRMPELGAEIEHADLVAWLVQEGDEIAAGDLIAEIETDKATVEFEAPCAGRIVELCVPAGAREVKVGELIARIEAAGDDALAAPADDAPSEAPAPAERAAAETPSPAIAPTAPATPALENTAVPVTPNATALARRLAEQSGLDLGALEGSGAHGRIRQADVHAALERGGASAPPATEAPAKASTKASPEHEGERVAHSSMRRTIAARLSEAKREIPHFYLDLDVTIDAVLALRKKLKEGPDGLSISVNDFVIAAAARAVRDVPEVNASWSEDAMLVHDSVDVAVAVATEGGLVTPIVRDADRKGLAVLSSEMKDLAERARARKLKPEEYRGGSLSISNLGMFGIRRVYAIVNPPHACILGVGRGEQRPVVVDGEITIATQMTLTLSADHRVVDGATGARFLGAVAQRLRDPLEIML